MKNFQDIVCEKIIRDISKTIKSAINEAFDFDSVDDKNKSLQITKNLKDYILTDTCEKIRNIFIEKRKQNYAQYIGNNDRFYEQQVKDIMDTLDKFCHDSEVEVRGKMIPALEYRHPVLYGPDWLLGCWKVIQVEKFRKKKANEDKIYYKDLPKDVRNLWEDIIKEKNFVGDIRVSDDFTFMAAIDPSKNQRGAIYQIFLTGHKKYTPDGEEITEIKESQNILNVNAQYLYHATPACYINSIKKYGLGGKLPKRRFWNYEGSPYENIKYGCFFATDEYVAESYVENSESFEELAEEYEDRYDKELEIAVFQIDINDLDLSKLSIDTNQIVEDGDDPTYFYDGIIPYSKLKRIKLY